MKSALEEQQKSIKEQTQEEHHGKNKEGSIADTKAWQESAERQYEEGITEEERDFKSDSPQKG